MHNSIVFCITSSTTGFKHYEKR